MAEQNPSRPTEGMEDVSARLNETIIAEVPEGLGRESALAGSERQGSVA